jgi:RNA polymerase sigma-70 factor (ECF subfamily)
MASLALAFERRMTFEDVFLAEYGRVASVARRIVGDAGTAEDVAQEVFAAYSRRFDGTTPQSGWLYLTATRLALNEVRRRRRTDRRERSDFLLRAVGTTRAQSDLDPQIVLEREQTQRMVGAAMLRLPERSAAILALKYGGLTYREIASTLGVAEANIGTYVVRAQRAFRKEIEDEQR